MRKINNIIKLSVLIIALVLIIPIINHNEKNGKDVSNNQIVQDEIYAKSAREMMDTIKKRYQADKKKILRTYAEQRALLLKVKDDIKKHGMSFRAEHTERLKYEINEDESDVPDDIDKEVKMQVKSSNSFWDIFINELKKQLRNDSREKKRKMRRRKDLKRELIRRKRREDERKRREKMEREKREKEGKDDELEKYEEELKKLDKDIDNLDGNIDKNKKKEKNKTTIDDLPNWRASAFNWRDRKKDGISMLTPVRSQGSCGSCWTFAAAGVLENVFIIQGYGVLDLSEQYFLDCAVYPNGRDVGSCNGGWYGPIFDYIKKNAAALERTIPYRGKELACRRARNNKYYTITWGYVNGSANIPSVSAMKQALCKYGAIAICLKSTPAFQAYRGGVFDEWIYVSSGRDINHAVLLIGWDDNKKGRKGYGSWLVKNSWGTRWGDKGYFWIEYRCNNIGYGPAYAVVRKK